jgi:hypothetical protein
MSYTVATPGGKLTPATVMAASTLLFVCAAIEVVNGVLGLLVIGPTRDLLNTELKGAPGADAAMTFETVGAIVGVVFAVILIGAMVALGVLLRQGKNPARIVTWVLGGLGVLCYGCTLSASAAGSAFSGIAANQNPESADLQRRMREVIPGWQTAVSTILTVVLLLSLVAIIILLMLPASNEFFRKEAEVWVPPTVPAGGFVPPQSSAPMAPYFPPAGPTGAPMQSGPPPAMPPAPPAMPPAAPPAMPPAPTVPPTDPGSGLPPAPPPPPA